MESPQASGQSAAGWRFTKWVQCPSDEKGSLTSVLRHVTGALRWIQAKQKYKGVMGAPVKDRLPLGRIHGAAMNTDACDRITGDDYPDGV